MKNNDKMFIMLLSALKDNFQRYVENYDYSKYAPYFHGTTMNNAREILKSGLLTRSSSRSCNVQDNKWEKTNRSLPDRVYFASCNERSRIVEHACRKSIESDQDDFMILFDKHGKNIEKMLLNECATLELINYKKYTHLFDCDEDSLHVIDSLTRFFSGQRSKIRYSDVPVIMEKLDRKIAIFYEKGYAFGGKELILEMIEKTPRALFSIADWGTVAILSTIQPSDLKLVSLNDYRKIKSCIFDEKDISIDRDVYYDYIDDNSPERMAELRKRLQLKYKNGEKS